MRFGTASKFSFSFALALLAFFLPWQVSLSFMPVIVLLEIFLSPFRPLSAGAHKKFLQFIGYLTFLGVLIVGMNGLLLKSGEVVLRLLWFNIYDGGIEFGLNVASRLLLLSSAILLFFVSTPIKMLADFLGHIGLSKKIVTIILLATFYLDQLPQRITQVFWAQEARGAPVRSNILQRLKSFFSILAPLTLSSLVESVDRGMALQLRGFQGYASLSQPRDLQDLKTAFLIVFSSLLALLSYLIWK
ncbi:MAG: hypothetical protein HYY49_00325 [Ignavibacteriales bacterium]|nr:hypothetical protein [Ignavibacteriales bacterium]